MVRGTYCRGVQGDDRRRSTRGVFFFCRNLFYPAMGVWQMFFYSRVHCQGDLKPSGHRQGPAAGHRKRIGGAPWQGGSGPSKRPVTVGEAYERRRLLVVEQSATPPNTLANTCSCWRIIPGRRAPTRIPTDCCEVSPEGTDFSKVSGAEVERAYGLIKDRPRKVLGHRTANEVYRGMFRLV